MNTLDEKILTIDKTICRHISSLNNSTRGAVSQDILAQLRNFVEHIMLKFYAKGGEIDNTYENICQAIKYVQTQGKLKILYKFHDFLQIVVSHYTLDEENSERLMLKYYMFLLKIRNLLFQYYNLEVLHNLENFPLNTDKTLQEYYERIAERLMKGHVSNLVDSEKYYVLKIKPFFVRNEIYYEITFTNANDSNSKSNRVIAFTKLDIKSNYAVKFKLINDNIKILGKTMPILIIVGWEVAIRDCEYRNLVSIITGTRGKVSYPEQVIINQFLTHSEFDLVELMDFPDTVYQQIIDQWKQRLRTSSFIDLLSQCRIIIKIQAPGCNILRYLLHSMNNTIIKAQKGETINRNLSNLYLPNGCIPFDSMPFINSPLQHNPRLNDIFDCIPSKDRKHELLARLIKNNAEVKGILFTAVKDITGFENIEELAEKYNNTLWYGHRAQSKLVIENGQIFISGYKNDTCDIITRLAELSKSGIKNYTASVNNWISDPQSGVDSEDKKRVLLKMFADSKVAIIYGSAGVGKSTLINHVANYFSDRSILFLAHTNPAVDNLKRKVTLANDNNTMTITKFINREDLKKDYDVLVIDECSTVSNKDMKAVLDKASFHLILLVGDTYQINAIRFGNWFSTVNRFVPKTAVFELKDTYRSNDEGLKNLWARVRNMDEDIEELIGRQGYSVTLNASIFNHAEDDEIILCLNYDGLYGINNINRFLQESNPNPAFMWGIQQYKIGDPILFNDANRFSPVIYNNMKGKIIDISIHNKGKTDEFIQFDVELEKVITELDAMFADFELIESTAETNSIIRFKVNKIPSTDDDSESSQSIIPFQIAYAVSIHKAQGLEYNSVKIVITEEIDELISHNIFYTAITRARKKLKIYWTPEVQRKVLSSIRPRDITKEVGILRKYISE